MALNQPTNGVQTFGDKKFSARGEIARAKLKRAAMTVMEKTGYHGMRISDVTTEAGVAAGLFYHYFNDLKKKWGHTDSVGLLFSRPTFWS